MSYISITLLTLESLALLASNIFMWEFLCKGSGALTPEPLSWTDCFKPAASHKCGPSYDVLEL